MTKQMHFYLIRGLIREKDHWGPFLDSMKRKFPESSISTLDIPGAGEYYTAPSPLSIKGMMEHMRRDFKKIQKDGEDSSLVSISLGGMIAIEWLRTYPEDFKSVTLINTSFGGISPLYYRLKPEAFLFLLKVPFLKGRSKEARILELVSNHPEVFSETLNRWEKIQRERPVSLPNTLRQLFAASLFKATDYLPTVPALLLASTQDRMVNIECSRSIAKKWKVPLYEHPTGGHDLTVDAPDWVADQIKLYLERCQKEELKL